MIAAADLHIHSKYSGATSEKMNIEELTRNAKIKGLKILGSGDCTHPLWLKELREKLEPVEGTGLFEFKDIFWVLTTELSTIYVQDKKIRKIHHVVLVPGFEIVEQINEKLEKYGRLDIDGRPIFNKLTSPELVEILKEISKDIEIIPSHAWTPWYGVFGSKSGFDSLEECYQDQVKHIHSIETGLSSDPPMNWRLSALDKITLVSNSDAHSPWPWRLGRECNVFDLKKITYWEIIDSIKKRDKKKFLFTIEVDPSYGKYHFTGHRNCGISLSPKEAKKFNDICPKCGRKLTVGVLDRVEQLADRPEGFIPKDAIPFKSLLPLYEIISYVTKVKQLYSKKVIEEQDKLIRAFDNELNVLLNVKKEELIKVTDERIADAIIKIREGKVKFIPGYDGVYGKPVFSEEEFKLLEKKRISAAGQKTLSEFGSVV